MTFVEQISQDLGIKYQASTWILVGPTLASGNSSSQSLSDLVQCALCRLSTVLGSRSRSLLSQGHLRLRILRHGRYQPRHLVHDQSVRLFRPTSGMRHRSISHCPCRHPPHHGALRATRSAGCHCRLHARRRCRQCNGTHRRWVLRVHYYGHSARRLALVLPFRRGLLSSHTKLRELTIRLLSASHSPYLLNRSSPGSDRPASHSAKDGDNSTFPDPS